MKLMNHVFSITVSETNEKYSHLQYISETNEPSILIYRMKKLINQVFSIIL